MSLAQDTGTAVPPEPAAHTAEEPPPGPLAAIWHDLTGLVGDHVHLVALELRQLRHLVARLVAVALVTAIVVASAWLSLLALIVVSLMHMGLPMAGALLIMVLLNALAGWIGVQRARGLLHKLSLPATLRRFTFMPPPEPPGTMPVPPVPPVPPAPSTPSEGPRA